MHNKPTFKTYSILYNLFNLHIIHTHLLLNSFYLIYVCLLITSRHNDHISKEADMRHNQYSYIYNQEAAIQSIHFVITAPIHPTYAKYYNIDSRATVSFYKFHKGLMCFRFCWIPFFIRLCHIIWIRMPQNIPRLPCGFFHCHRSLFKFMHIPIVTTFNPIF